MSRLESLRDALAVSPANVPLLMLYAQACTDEFAFDEAREKYEKALEIEPNHLDARLGVARVLYLTGKISEAVVRTEGILQINARYAEAVMLLSRLHWAEGDRPGAQEYYFKAIEMKPALQDPALARELGIDFESGPAGSHDAQTDLEPELETWTEGDDEEVETEVGRLERPTISFVDVGGMEEVKEEIRMKIIYPLHNRDLFKAYGKKLGGGVLLYGPPGCGKTLISHATAGEISANFFSVGIHQILDLYIGNSEKNLHQIFQLARDHAPTILFFDEVDALAADRKDLRASGMRTLINQFLAEMDGNVSNNEGVLILGATNAPWHLDPAFRRPGRFDRVVFIPPPDESARDSIISILARDKPVQEMDTRALARKTKDFSGADLRAMFDLATERALSHALKDGRIVPLTTNDLLQASKELKPSTRTWFESAKNYAIYSNQGGFYDDVLKFLGIRKSNG